MDMSLCLEIAVAAFLLFIAWKLAGPLVRPKSSPRLPPGPKGWPVIGALPLMGSMPHVTLAEMAKKYGPIIHLKMGARDMVVASSPDAARAFLMTAGANFSNRPLDSGPTHLVYNAQDLAFAEYGPKWRLFRKLTNHHMLGAKAINDWTTVRQAEIGHMLQAMCEMNNRGEPVNITDKLTIAAANILGQVILSRRVFEGQGQESIEFKDVVIELMKLVGAFNIGDYIPAVKWMDAQGIEGSMKKLHKKLDMLVTKMLEQHAATANQRKGKPDLVDFLKANSESSDSERVTETNIKAVLLDLFVAGTDTATSEIEWALSELLIHPSILKRVQEEMDVVIGRDRLMKESDISKLPYLQAVCKETMRKHPTTPLNIPRISSEACEVSGYHIPANTRLSVNIWAIGRDPNVWENPLDFNPDRFLDERFSKMEPTGGTDFELIPFGAGRRMCAGARMGKLLVEYVLGSLVHSFDWKLPDGVDELNMDEVFGLTLQRAVPLLAHAIPRLSPGAYAS